jgi:aquaporin Z
MAEKKPAVKPAAKPAAKPEKKPRAEATEYQVDVDVDTWEIDAEAPSSLLARFFTEYIGTFIFIFLGLGVTLFSSLLMGDTAGTVVNALAWGFTLLALVVATGRISGAHFNPAVTLGAWISGRFPGRDVAPCILIQTCGAVTAGALLVWLANGFPSFAPDSGSGYVTGDAIAAISIGTDTHSPLQMDTSRGLTMEFIATGLLVAVVLAATSLRAPRGQAPFTIGLSFAVLILISTPFTNGGLNPARVTATALFAKQSDGTNWAIGQLWWWWVVALVAGAFIGLLFRAFGPEEDLEAVEVLEVIED